MARMGDGYGSECHLLRFLGRHRRRLDGAVRDVIGASAVEWLDYPFDPSNRWQDGEWKGVEFLEPENAARQAWATFWPQRGNPPNWDAIGRAQIGGRWEWLLVEAKAHLNELRSDCQASEAGGRPMIRSALDRVKAALGASTEADWLNGYYQYANRLAVLWHLMEHREPARLLFVYFTGDRFPNAGFACPEDEEGWREALIGRSSKLGLPDDHALAERVHSLFLPVRPLEELQG